MLPSDYRGGGLTVEIIWAATSAPSGNVVWAAAFERITTIASDSFASDQTTTSAASGTNGNTSTASIAFTNGAQMDSLAAGEAFRLRITRDGDNGSDTMTGDAELVRVVVRET